jgi:hypothetical protein
MQQQTFENDCATQQTLVHDINASLSALHGAMEVITDEWRSNPELVDRILPLTLEKLSQLHFQLAQFRSFQHKIPSSKK